MRRFLTHFSTRFVAVPFFALALSLLAQAVCSAEMLIELDGRNFASGNIVGLENNALVWSSNHFLEPLRFKLENVVGVVAASEPNDDPKVNDEFRIELVSNRDVLYANLVSIDSETIEVESSRTGKFQIPRAAIQRISRIGDDRNVYPVPARLKDWKTSSSKHWESAGNGIMSKTAGANAFALVNLPVKATIEIELAWTGKPSFAIRFGTEEKDKDKTVPFSVEAWNGSLVAQRSTEKKADLAMLAELTSDDSIYLVVHLDQAKGIMVVNDASGKTLGEIRLAEEIPSKSSKTKDKSKAVDGEKLLKAIANVGDQILKASRKGITFVNHDQLSIKHFRVRGWSGLIAENSAEKQIAIRTDEGLATADDFELSGNRLKLTSDDENEESREFPLASVREIDFNNASSESKHNVVATWSDGMRLSGQLTDLSPQEIRLQNSETEMTLSLDNLRGIFFVDESTGEQKVVMTEEDDTARRKQESYADWYARRRAILKRKVDDKDGPDAFTKTKQTKNRNGTLELMDTRLRGHLVESKKGPGECLVWQCVHAQNASTLNRDAFGRIVYVEQKKKKRKRPANNQFGNGRIFVNGVQRTQTRRTARREKLAGAAVHLRSGDTIPCTVTKIDEAAVHINSKLTDTKSIPHKYVKAAQLTSTIAIPPLSKKKKARLLTLPRMHRDIPPQHLLFSTKGDVLRGSVMGLLEQQVELEVRLDSHMIPKKRVSAIVWLHQDEVETDNGETEKQEPEVQEEQPEDSPGIEVQAIGSTGSRFTFFASSFENQLLSGTSEVLQDVNANIHDVDQILIGGFIRRAARSLPFHRWRLTSARDPKFVTEGDEESQETKPGTESSLVGSPAPAIKLKMLDGSRFELAKHQGHVVVLDFWASWCGPCLQVMPKVEEVVGEFKDQEVELFAINLEETAEQVKTTLERRKLNLPVVLDRDGVAAQRYEATAIPQTVIIAPDGTVTRVFVGSSRNFSEQLRTAIEEVLADESEG